MNLYNLIFWIGNLQWEEEGAWGQLQQTVWGAEGEVEKRPDGDSGSIWWQPFGNNFKVGQLGLGLKLLDLWFNRVLNKSKLGTLHTSVISWKWNLLNFCIIVNYYKVVMK